MHGSRLYVGLSPLSKLCPWPPPDRCICFFVFLVMASGSVLLLFFFDIIFPLAFMVLFNAQGVPFVWPHRPFVRRKIAKPRPRDFAATQGWSLMVCFGCLDNLCQILHFFGSGPLILGFFILRGFPSMMGSFGPRGSISN